MARNPHQLTREQMEKIIADGGSVLYNGSIINQAGQLPSKAELAKGDPAQESAVQSELQAKMADLQAQLDLLKANAPQTPVTNEPPELTAAGKKKAKEEAEAKAKADAEAAAEAEAKAKEEEAARLAAGGGQ